MFYVKRGDDNRIISIYAEDTGEGLQPLDENDEEVLEFLMRCGLDRQYAFLKADLDLIRVIEDLIHILMEKDVIRITDFPEPVIDKLVNRKKIRQQFKGLKDFLDTK